MVICNYQGKCPIDNVFDLVIAILGIRDAIYKALMTMCLCRTFIVCNLYLWTMLKASYIFFSIFPSTWNFMLH